MPGWEKIVREINKYREFSKEQIKEITDLLEEKSGYLNILKCVSAMVKKDFDIIFIAIEFQIHGEKVKIMTPPTFYKNGYLFCDNDSPPFEFHRPIILEPLSNKIAKGINRFIITSLLKYVYDNDFGFDIPKRIKDIEDFSKDKRQQIEYQLTIAYKSFATPTKSATKR